MEVEEGRKRVLAIMGSILVSHQLKTTEDLLIADRVREQSTS